jgi:myo-inositol-hexaphosphate 3-phosphohydrolase
VPNGGDAADDAAIWVHPIDPSQSAIVATDKQGGLGVYDLGGNELHYYAGGRPNGVALLDGFLLGGLPTAIVAVSERASDSIGVYVLDPLTRGLTGVAIPALSLDIQVYGLCSYRSAATGRHYVFVTDESGTVEQWELFGVGIGTIDATKVRTLALGSRAEGCVADEERGDLYVAEEDVGIWRYGAEPNDGSTRGSVDSTGVDGHLTADVEGLAIYAAGEGGYLLASSQGSDDFAVYERSEGNAYVGRFAVDAGTVDAVSNTDGIEVANVPLGPAFPEGVFIAQDGTNDDGNQNFKLVPWERIRHVLPAESEPDPEGPACARPYADTSPWNTPVGSSPAYHPQSDFHATALAGVLSSDPTQYTYPVYEVSASTPRVPVALSGWYSNVIDEETLENQRGGYAFLPIPAAALPAAGLDRQMILLDPATGDEWGVSNLERDLLGNWTAWNAYHYNTAWSGVPPRDASDRPFFPRGAGVPYLAGLVRPCEIERGRIDHALAFAYDYPTSEYVYPATKSDGVGTDPADMPEGTRLQLDPSLSEAEIRAWGCTGPCLTIARALQEYGMYVIDNSGREKVMLEYEGTAAWNGLVDSKTVNPIPLAAFKVLLPPQPGGS